MSYQNPSINNELYEVTNEPPVVKMTDSLPDDTMEYKCGHICSRVFSTKDSECNLYTLGCFCSSLCMTGGGVSLITGACITAGNCAPCLVGAGANALFTGEIFLGMGFCTIASISTFHCCKFIVPKCRPNFIRGYEAE